MKPKRKPGHWNDRDRKLATRCDHCGRHDCACDRRSADDDEWREVPARLTREAARALGVEL